MGDIYPETWISKNLTTTVVPYHRLREGFVPFAEALSRSVGRAYPGRTTVIAEGRAIRSP